MFFFFWTEEFFSIFGFISIVEAKHLFFFFIGLCVMTYKASCMIYKIWQILMFSCKYKYVIWLKSVQLQEQNLEIAVQI